MNGGPRDDFERRRGEHFDSREQRRGELEAAVLIGSAELGYSNLTVQAVLDRTGISRNRFYREFDSLAACFASAYAREIERLADQMLESCEGGWQSGLDRSLEILNELVVQKPLLARALFVEVHAAGEPALAKKKEVLERLSHALDGARREIPRSRHSPPPMTATFMLSAIEASVCHFFFDPSAEDFHRTVAALGELIIEAYRGRP